MLSQLWFVHIFLNSWANHIWWVFASVSYSINSDWIRKQSHVFTSGLIALKYIKYFIQNNTYRNKLIFPNHFRFIWSIIQIQIRNRFQNQTLYLDSSFLILLLLTLIAFSFSCFFVTFFTSFSSDCCELKARVNITLITSDKTSISVWAKK